MNKTITLQNDGSTGPLRSSRCGAADFLKALAIVGVLLIHASTDGYYNPGGSFQWFSALFWGSISRASVPVFLMVSGALMLDPARNVTLKKLWSHNILRILIALLFWAFAYQLYRQVPAGGLTAVSLLQAVKETLLFHHEFHLYYLHIILLVYALLPATRLIAAHASKGTMQYLLILWAVLGLLYPTFKGLWPLTLFYGIPTQYAINLTYASIGYGLLGWYLRSYTVSAWKWAVAAGVGFLLVFGGVTGSSLAAGQLDTSALEGVSPGVALMAAGICGWAFSFFRDRPVPKAVLTLSKASFCIYLVHVFFLYIWGHFGLNANTGPCALFVPLTAAAMLVCSFVVWLILSHIPIVRNWLI